jgi:hypothetical protein
MRLVLLSLLVILLAIVSISINPSTTWQLVDPQGHPVEGAYIAYHYIGDTFKIIESGSYFRSGSVVRTDSTGTFYIPWAFHLHLPFPFQGNLSTFTLVLYTPRHCITRLAASEAHMKRTCQGWPLFPDISK